MGNGREASISGRSARTGQGDRPADKDGKLEVDTATFQTDLRHGQAELHSGPSRPAARHRVGKEPVNLLEHSARL
jgi:hypothetical protein